MARKVKGEHVCERPNTCTCWPLTLEPDEKCPVHGAGGWSPRCETCGRLMPWPKAEAADAAGEEG